MRNRSTVVMAALSLVASAGVARAQVGYPPSSSPYRDLEYRMEASLFTGYYSAGSDPAGVAPGNGPMLGGRYDVRLGGPAWFTAKVAGVFSDRTVLDPRAQIAQRDLGSQSWPVYLMDVGLSMNLTGFKSYRRLVPVVGVGVGVASDLRGKADVGEFKFGTPFAFSFGGGVKWIPGGRTQYRLDVTDHIYEVRYPDTYYRAYNGQAPVLRTTVPKNRWTNNIGITLGISHLFFR